MSRRICHLAGILAAAGFGGEGITGVEIPAGRGYPSKPLVGWEVRTGPGLVGFLYVVDASGAMS